MNTNTITFTTIQRAGIEALRGDLAQRIDRAVIVEYGSTDYGQHWAALSVATLDAGSFGQPGPLVTILVGTGIRGEAEAMAPDGSAVPGVPVGAGFSEVLKTAGDAAVWAWIGATEGETH